MSRARAVDADAKPDASAGGGKPGPPAQPSTSPAEVEIARQLIAEATALGIYGPQADFARRRLRDTAIVAAVAAGQKPTKLAEDFAITPTRVRQILRDRSRAPSVLEARPMQLLEDLLRTYRDDIADLEAMARRYLDSHPAVALGAKRSAIETREKLVMVLESLGKLPDNLELFRSESEMLRVAEIMLDKLDGLRQGKLSGDEVFEFFRSLLLSRDRGSIDVRELPPGSDN